MMHMPRCAALVGASLALAIAPGCNPPQRFVVDTAAVPDFNWNGKVRIIYEYTGLFSGWCVHHVELLAADGRAIALNTTRTEPSVHLIGPEASREIHEVQIAKESRYFADRAWALPRCFQPREKLAGAVYPYPPDTE